MNTPLTTPDHRHTAADRPCASRRPAHLVTFGLIVAGLGTLALLDRLQLAGTALLHTFWPLALVLLGAARLLTARHTASRLSGAVLIAIGTLLTARHLDFATPALLSWWPVLPIAAGLALVIRGLRRHG